MEKEFYLGKRVREKELEEARSRVLTSDERLMSVIRGILVSKKLTSGRRRKDAGVSRAHGLLLVTDKRIIFYEPRIFGSFQQLVFYYDQITAVASRKGMVADRIEIDVSSDSVAIGSIPKGDGEPVSQRIREMIARVKTSPPITQVSSQIDVTDQIEKLGNLRDKGLITEEEFER